MGGVVGAGAGAFDGCKHADAGADVALVGKGGHALGGGLVQGGQRVGARSGQVVGRARLDRQNPHRQACTELSFRRSERLLPAVTSHKRTRTSHTAVIHTRPAYVTFDTFRVSAIEMM